jgi:predicted SAM-dependent methyltransferase
MTGIIGRLVFIFGEIYFNTLTAKNAKTNPKYQTVKTLKLIFALLKNVYMINWILEVEDLHYQIASN